MAERKAIIPPGVSPNPALSPGIQVGDTLYVSGQVAVDASGNMVGEGDCEVQTRQVMANIRAVVKAVGGSMENVVKITCFLTDVANYPAYSKRALWISTSRSGSWRQLASRCLVERGLVGCPGLGPSS